MTNPTSPAGHRLRQKLETALLTPIRAFRLRYLPLLMVYFAYGALGLITIAENFWIKSALTLTPSELAALSVWLTLPWTIKMVFGELVDAVPVFGSQRRAYVLIGGTLVALGLLTLAGAAGGWLTFASQADLYRIGSFLSVVGVVLVLFTHHLRVVLPDPPNENILRRKPFCGAWSASPIERRRSIQETSLVSGSVIARYTSAAPV